MANISPFFAEIVLLSFILKSSEMLKLGITKTLENNKHKCIMIHDFFPIQNIIVVSISNKGATFPLVRRDFYRKAIQGGLYKKATLLLMLVEF